LGVEVRLGHGVDQIDADGVIVAGERIASKSVIWTAGVAPSPAGKWLDVATDRGGRVRVQNDLSVPGHPEIFVVGDTAYLEQDGKPLPGLAPVAMQGGRYAGTVVRKRIAGANGGLLAWLVWAAIHLEFLAESNLRVSVFLQWFWSYVTGRRGSRLILDRDATSTASGALASDDAARDDAARKMASIA
jgi:NADH:ubiquinone reductase (H+-translocating)